MKVQQANVEAERAYVSAEDGLALYLGKLFGSNDTEAVVLWITALLELVLDPLAVLLTLASTRGRVRQAGSRHSAVVPNIKAAW